jgi:hypothetical protein
MRKVWSTGGLAMLLCLAGCVTLFLPWAEAIVVTFDPEAPQTPLPKGSLSRERLYGFQLWNGVASAAAFLMALLLLVITGPLQPTPVWRSAALLACSVAALGVAIAIMVFPPEALRNNPEAGRMIVGVSWGYGHRLALGLSGGLALLAAVELRWWVGRRMRDRVEPSAQGPASQSALPKT